VDERGVSTVTRQNLSTITSYGGSSNTSMMQLGAVGGFVSLRGYREVRDASNLRADFSGSSLRYSVIGNVNVRATSDLNLQGIRTYLPAREMVRWVLIGKNLPTFWPGTSGQDLPSKK
jgi:hypothetical protein